MGVRTARAARGAVAWLMLLTLVACTRDDPHTDLSSRARGVEQPAMGAYLGTHFSASLPDRMAALEGLEESLGRQVAIDHVYHRFDAVFPTAYDRATVAAGRTLFLSWSCRTKSGVVRWDEIADGSLDPIIDARADAVASIGEPVLMSFCHEPAAYSARIAQAPWLTTWRRGVGWWSGSRRRRRP